MCVRWPPTILSAFLQNCSNNWPRCHSAKASPKPFFNVNLFNTKPSFLLTEKKEKLLYSHIRFLLALFLVDQWILRWSHKRTRSVTYSPNECQYLCLVTSWDCLWSCLPLIWRHQYFIRETNSKINLKLNTSFQIHLRFLIYFFTFIIEFLFWFNLAFRATFVLK